MPRENIVTFKNLYPNQKFKAIHQQSELGYNSFKFAKQTQPMRKLIYKKFEKRDPVLANKKFFRANPDLSEFAKAQPMPKEEDLIQQFINPSAMLAETAKPSQTGQSKKQAEIDVNFLKVGKQFHGIYDRFQPGRAWYHNVHGLGQLGIIRNPENEAKFYKLANNKS